MGIKEELKSKFVTGYNITQADYEYWVNNTYFTTDTVSASWNNLSDKPDTFNPNTHSHPISGVDTLQDTLNSLSPLIHSHAISGVVDLQNTLDSLSPVIHSHAISAINSLQDTLDSFSVSGHVHMGGVFENTLTDEEYIEVTTNSANYKLVTPTTADYGLGIAINTAYTGGSIVAGVAPTRAVLMSDNPPDGWYAVTLDENYSVPTWCYYTAHTITLSSIYDITKPVFKAGLQKETHVNLSSFIIDLVGSGGGSLAYAFLWMSDTAKVGSTITFICNQSYFLFTDSNYLQGPAPTYYDNHASFENFTTNIVGFTDKGAYWNSGYNIDARPRGLRRGRVTTTFICLDSGWQPQDANLLTGDTDKDGWGNNPEISASGRLQRYSLSEAQYIELDSNIGHVTVDGTIESSGYVIINGVTALVNPMRNQTIICSIPHGDFNTNHYSINNNFVNGSRIRFCDTTGDPQLVVFSSEHRVNGNATLANDYAQFGLHYTFCDNVYNLIMDDTTRNEYLVSNPTYTGKILNPDRYGGFIFNYLNGVLQDSFYVNPIYYYLWSSTALNGDTVEFQIDGNISWSMGFFNLEAWMNGYIPWNKIDISTQTDLERSLGNPSIDGQILSSSVSGVRTWITPPTGGSSLFFNFYKADGSSDTISLISGTSLPFKNTNGIDKNIALIGA